MAAAIPLPMGIGVRVRVLGKAFPCSMYGSPVLGSTRDTIQKEADKWVKWFEENAPGVKYFWYITVSPGNKYPWIKEKIWRIKSNSA
jgi:hypothetical protein